MESMRFKLTKVIKNNFKILISFLTCLLFFGCIETEYHFDMNSKGKGSLEFIYSIINFSELSNMLDPNSKDLNEEEKKVMAEELLQKMTEQFKPRKEDKIQTDGYISDKSIILKLKINFQNLDELENIYNNYIRYLVQEKEMNELLYIDISLKGNTLSLSFDLEEEKHDDSSYNPFDEVKYFFKNKVSIKIEDKDINYYNYSNSLVKEEYNDKDEEDLHKIKHTLIGKRELEFEFSYAQYYSDFNKSNMIQLKF